MYINTLINYLAARVKKNSLDSTSTEQLTTVKGATESKTKKTKKEKEEDKKKKSTIEKPNVINTYSKYLYFSIYLFNLSRGLYSIFYISIKLIKTCI